MRVGGTRLCDHDTERISSSSSAQVTQGSRGAEGLVEVQNEGRVLWTVRPYEEDETSRVEEPSVSEVWHCQTTEIKATQQTQYQEGEW